MSKISDIEISQKIRKYLVAVPKRFQYQYSDDVFGLEDKYMAYEEYDKALKDLMNLLMRLEND